MSTLAPGHPSPTGLSLLSDLATKHPELRSIPISKEILEVAEEIVSASDVPGIEPSTLLYLLQVALFLDRQQRGGGE